MQKAKEVVKNMGSFASLPRLFIFLTFTLLGWLKKKKKEDADRKKGDTNVAHLLLIFL